MTKTARKSYKEKQHEYYIAHKEKIYKDSLKWRASNPDAARKHQETYRKKHGKEIRKKQSDRRRGIDRSIEKLSRKLSESKKILLFTKDDWKTVVDSFNGKCAYCQKKSKLTVDHFIPVSKHGHTIPGNIVPACLSCNS